ncbi:MAG: immunoglobulin domain-containing protein [Verrucomicrobiales bacterium]|nr:immunoglobulin domain-containing protein [Verrucomicrobiales bacterium]
MKPHRRLLLLALVGAGLANLGTTPSAQAQEITPVWVQHLNKTDNLLPILRKGDAPTEKADGTSLFDNYAAFVRYDATRLLLGIRENGIDETDASTSAADRALAAQYPDRSIIWINPTNGAPMGVAHKVPVLPVELTPDSQSSPLDFFWNWGIDEGPEGQRAIYTGYKNVILRWAPAAGGGWSTTPTVAWTEPVPGVGDGSSGGDGSLSWRWRTFRVAGAGPNTVIYAGGATWRMSMHVQKFVTTDGLNFTPAARVNDRDGGIKQRYSYSGMNTKAVKYAKDPSRPNLELFFTPSFPASGRELKPRRFTLNPDSPRSGSFTEAVAASEQRNRNNFFDPDNEAAGGLPAFRWEGDEAPAPSGTAFYDGNWSFAMDTDDGLDYLVNYSGPSWNQVYGTEERRPAWLGIHRLSGRIASGQSSYRLDFDEQTEVTLDTVGTGNSYTYDANVNVYADPASPANLQKAEVLWSGGSFGFGVFTVQNVAATLVSSPTNQTVAAGTNVTLVADVTGSPNDFRWYRNGRPLPDAPYYVGAGKAALTIQGVTPADAGTYQLRWTNPISGAGQTATAVLTVTGSFVRWSDPVEIPARTAETTTLEGVLTQGAASFTLEAGGLSAYDKVNDEGNSTGDTLFYRYERVTGDFDKRVRLVSLTTDPVATETTDRNARAGLLLRESTDPRSPTLEIAALNPAGADLVRVSGRGRFNAIYSQSLSRNYPGVSANLPNQWLRVRRVGNAFTFYVSKDGTTWSAVSEQYQVFPETILLGTFASPDQVDGVSKAVAEFAEYSDVTVSDTIAPTLVSAGTIDGKVIGVKFSEPVDSWTATRLENYTVSGGALVSARTGIGANTVYLTVAGLTEPTFSVTVHGGVVDLAGNPVAGGSVANGRKSAWTSTDIGYIQNPANRPTPGDDPYVVGQAVAVSSEANPEVELIGGGSNAYNIGDYMHYLYREITGDFDVAVAIDRFDKRGFAGGYANAGIHVRAGLYRTDNTAIGEITKVPAYVNVAYYEASGPNRAAIELNRPAAGDNYGNSGPYENTTEVGGLVGYFPALRATDAAGTIAANTSPTQAKWLRVKRVGQSFTSFFSYDGVTWKEQEGSTRTMENLPATVLVGVAYQNDAGYGIPPDNAYNGTGTRDADGKPTLNESNYGVVRVHSLGSWPPPSAAPSLLATRSGNTLTLSWTGSGFQLQQSASVSGGWQNSTLTVTSAGAVNTVTLTPGQAQQFFRLIQ